MSDTNSPKFIQIPITQVSAEALIRQLSDEILQLRQVMIMDKIPDGLSLPFALWTREAIRQHDLECK